MTYLGKARMVLLGLAVVLASSLTAAPGLPEEGRVLDVTFGKSPTESVTHGNVKFDADSKTWRAGCDSLAGREAKYSIVITYRVEKVDSLTAVELVRLYNGNAYEQGFFSVDYRGEVDVAGYSSPESDNRRWHSVEAGMEDGQEFTMVQTVDMQTREQHLVAAGHDYAYYSAPLAELANPAPNQVRVYESKWIKPVRVTVYSRVLTDQEITAAMGAAPEKHAPSEMDKDKTSFSFLGVIDLIIIVAVIMLIVRARKEKLKPMTLDELAKAGRGELTQEQARQEALRYLDEANAPWQWEPLADQEGYGCSYPKSAKELRQSREALKKAIATGCADEDVAEDINMLILLHNRASGLTFNGWFPFVLVAFIAIIAMPIIKGDFWHMVLSWQYLGYWAGLAAYIIAAMAFRAVALRGKPVEELDTMKDKVANMTGATVAGAVAVGGAAVGLLGFLGKQLEWALDHSITHYRVFRNGVHVGNTSEMNPTGLIYFAIVIVALLVLLYIAWSIVMLILQFAAIYKFTRNYLIRR